MVLRSGRSGEIGAELSVKAAAYVNLRAYRTYGRSRTTFLNSCPFELKSRESTYEKRKGMHIQLKGKGKSFSIEVSF